MKRLLAWLAADSVLLTYALSAAVTAWTAFGFRASPHQVAAVAVIAQGVVTILTALATRPVRIPAITGAVSTITVAAAAFGLHLSAAQTGTAMPALAAVLALLIRSHVSPATVKAPAGAHEAPQACSTT